MTDAEQVACDALRMAGLGELADNLEFAREAVRVREYIIERLESDVEGYCVSCGVHAESESHRMSCRLVAVFATQDGWQLAEIERAHGEALRQSQLRREPLFRVDPASLEAGVTYAGSGSRLTVSPGVLAAYNREYRPVSLPESVAQRLQREWDAIRADLPEMPPK